MSYWQLDKTMLVFRNYTDIIAEQLTLTFWLINDKQQLQFKTLKRVTFLKQVLIPYVGNITGHFLTFWLTRAVSQSV